VQRRSSCTSGEGERIGPASFNPFAAMNPFAGRDDGRFSGAPAPQRGRCEVEALKTSSTRSTLAAREGKPVKLLRLNNFLDARSR